MGEARAGRIPYTGVPEVSPELARPVFQNIQTNPREFGAGVGQALEKLGQGFKVTADVYSEIAAQQATTGWRQGVRKILNGDPTVPGDVGLMGKRGQAFMDARGGAEQQIDDLTQQTLGTLGTARSQLMFNDESRRYQFYISSEIGRKYDQESAAWATDVNNAQYENRRAEAAEHPEDEARATDALAGMNEARSRNLIAKGQLPLDGVPRTKDQLDIANEEHRQSSIDLLEARIHAAAVRNPAFAQQLFKSNEELLSTSRNYDALAGYLQRHASMANGNAMYQSALAAAGGGAVARAAPGGRDLAPTGYTGGYTWEQMEPQLRRLESSGRTDAYNPTPTSSGHASGLYGITSGTWHDFAPQAGVSLAQYPEARNAPAAAQAAVGKAIYQARGLQPWQSWREALASAGGAAPTLTAGGAQPIPIPGGATPAPSPIPQMENYANAEIENARHLARMEEALGNNPSAASDPQGYDYALRRIRAEFENRQIGLNAGKAAIVASRSAALDEYTKAVLAPGADQNAIHAKMLADQRLDGETRQNLARLQEGHLVGQANGETMKYGPRINDVISRIALDDRDPNKIRDSSQIIKWAAEKDPETGERGLTQEGVRYGMDLLNDSQKQGSGVTQIISHQLAYAKQQLSYEYEAQGYKLADPEGQKIFNSKFAPVFYRHIDEKPPDKSMYDWLSKEEIDKMIAPLKRPPSQLIRSMAGENLVVKTLPGFAAEAGEIPGIPYASVWALSQNPELRGGFDRRYGTPDRPTPSDAVLGPAPAPPAPPRPTAPMAVSPTAPMAGEQEENTGAHLLPQFSQQLGDYRPLGPGEYVNNKDGTWSNEITATVADTGLNGSRWTVIPRLWLQDGKPTILSEDDATKMAVARGVDLEFPSFDTKQEADRFAEAREARWQHIQRGDASIPPLWTRRVGQATTPPATAQPAPTNPATDQRFHPAGVVPGSEQ